MSNLTNEQKTNLVLNKVIEGLEKEGVVVSGQYMTTLMQFKSMIVSIANDVDRAVLTKQQGITLMTKATEKVVKVILTDAGIVATA